MTVTEKYRAVNEGKLEQGEFVRQMRLAYPQHINQFNGFTDAVQILKNRGLLFEEKTMKHDVSDESIRRALDVELTNLGADPVTCKDGEMIEKAKAKAIANLSKDPLHYYNLMSNESSKVDKNDQTKEVKRGSGEVDTLNGMKKADLKEEVIKEGTRALVGYLSGDRLTTTYNHYDGYPSNLGKGLMTHYNDDEKAKEIAMKGYITGMDPDTGEVKATHNDPPTKIKLPEEAYEIAKEIAEEIDSMGAEYGYIWDDQLDKWATIKNTGIRSMIDQITDKLLNKPARDMDHAMQGIDPDLYETEDIIPAEEVVVEPTLKETLGGIVAFLKSKGAKNDSIKDFIKTHGNDIKNMKDMDDVEDEYNNFLSVNTDYVDEEKGKDHDKDGDIDSDDYMAAKDKAIKKAMGKEVNESIVKKNIKSIITKVLEEEVINEAATNDLAKIAEDYGAFEGLKPAIISLQNIVTEIESFYDKTRGKIQKVYNDLGEVRNEEGLKVGAFIAPSIENAFKRDLRPITKQQFHGGLDMPRVKRMSETEVEKPYTEMEAPKETVFTPVNEKK